MGPRWDPAGTVINMIVNMVNVKCVAAERLKKILICYFYPGGGKSRSPDTACCKRLGTWNDIYIYLGSQRRCTTLQIDY